MKFNKFSGLALAGAVILSTAAFAGQKWGYTGDVAADNWGHLDPSYEKCKSGQFQSPVDLKATIRADLPALNFHYKDTDLRIENNGHTIQVNFPKGNKLKVDGKKYQLLQYHFHTPSEHTVDGKVYPLEVHLVHKSKKGELAVVGIMIKEGHHNEAIEKVWKYMPMQAQPEQKHKDVKINAADLLPGDLRYSRLMGSLTTPPCSEGVNWHVLHKPIEMSKGQISKFKRAFELNARPVQDLHHRMIVTD